MISYRLLPVTRTMAKQLERLASTCRFVWNHFLADQLNHHLFDRCFADSYSFKPISVNQPANYFWLGNEFTALRRRTPWLQDHSFNIIRSTLICQALAWHRYQRILVGRQKGSNRRNRAKRKLNRTCATNGNQRRRWAYEAPRHIADRAHTVAVAPLPVKRMSKSAKGTVAQPGRRVKQKAGLKRSIQATGWGHLRAVWLTRRNAWLLLIRNTPHNDAMSVGTSTIAIAKHR